MGGEAGQEGVSQKGGGVTDVWDWDWSGDSRPSEAFKSLHAEIEADKRRIQREQGETRLFIEETQQFLQEIDDARELVRHHQNRSDAYAFTPEEFEEFRGIANPNGAERVNWKKEGF